MLVPNDSSFVENRMMALNVSFMAGLNFVFGALLNSSLVSLFICLLASVVKGIMGVITFLYC